MKITDKQSEWVKNILEKAENKLAVTLETIATPFPYTTVGGICTDEPPIDGVCFWTNGFWAGILWLMYLHTKKEKYMKKAIFCEHQLDRAFEQYVNLHHDVGFMWLTSAVAHYRITGDADAKKRGLKAADMLASRYNTDGGFIRAWNGDENIGVAIIDCMMNIPILYWAYEETGDPRYRMIAVHHADKTLANHLRADGSANHIVRYEPITGEKLETPAGQGCAPGSSWSRGQAWAIYGFVLSYIHTGDVKYLDAAKRTAHYFIACIGDEYVAKCDFRAPKEPVLYDSTAGFIAACGMIEISKAVPEAESALYFDCALKILHASAERFCTFDTDSQLITKMGTASYTDGHHIPIIYGDYYFLEALMKLNGNDLLFW